MSVAEAYLPIYVFICVYIGGIFLPYQLGIPKKTTIDECLINKGTQFTSASGLVTFTLFLIVGFRPLDPVFGDMMQYAYKFNFWGQGVALDSWSDPGFNFLYKVASAIANFRTLIIFIAAVYFYSWYKISVLLSEESKALVFAACLITLDFYIYAVNGLRQGLAIALVLMFLTRQHKVISFGFFVGAVAMHASALMFLMAHLVSRKLSWWFCSALFICALALSIRSDFFFSLLAEWTTWHRFDVFSSATAETDFSVTGYRLDFVALLVVYFISIQLLYFRGAIGKKIWYDLIKTLLLVQAAWLAFFSSSDFANRALIWGVFLAPPIIVSITAQRRAQSDVRVVGVLVAVFTALTTIYSLVN